MKDKNLYNESLDNLLKKYETNINGLTEDEAAIRLEKYGANKLEERQKESFFVKIFKQLTSMSIMFLNFVVLFSVVVSYVREDSYIDSIIVGLISIINTILGYYQSKSADKTILEINKMFEDDVIVIRDGIKKKINNRVILFLTISSQYLKISVIKLLVTVFFTIIVDIINKMLLIIP